MIARTEEERAGLIEAGRRLGVILEQVAGMVAPGVSTDALNARAEQLITEGGDVPAFKGYTPEGAPRPYPAALCVSINDEVVHGIPNENPRTLADGDIVGLDLGLTHNGFVVDSAVTVAVGGADETSLKLMEVTKRALANGIAVARPGNRIGDISHAIEDTYQNTGFSVVKVLGGHGVGQHVHEEPWVANTGTAGTGPEIGVGEVLALEPIANAGKAAVQLGGDGYTYRTKDGSRSAHFEHTILVGEHETLVLTLRPGE